MKITLITGLDGSGKTTFLNNLKEKAGLKAQQIINVPQINLKVLTEGSELYKVAEFVNKLSKVGDVLQVPQLKAVALFASMLLFKDLVAEQEKNGVKEIYCERHPLIDTGTYAKFYADKLHPESTDKNFLEKLDEKNSKELNYIVKLLPETYIDNSKGLVENIMSFIYQWFYIEKRFSLDELKELYNLELPSEIYYLQAEPEYLIERIRKRKVLEAHETINSLRMMEQEYQKLFKILSKHNNKLVQVVDVREEQNVLILLDKLIRC